MTIKWEGQMFVKMSLKDRFNIAMYISPGFCEQTGKLISRKIVSHRLNKEKLVAQIPYCKSLISKKNQKVHLDFATEHILGTEEQWNMVHFSDESKFNLFGSDGKRFVGCKNGECLSPQSVKKTVKFGGGSIIVWRMISSVGVGPIVCFHSSINASVYKELLCQHALLHLCKGTVETPIFMQDNVPCHKAKTVLIFLWRRRNSCYEVATTKHRYESYRECMEIIGEKALNRNPQNIDDLWGFLKEEWESLTATFCKKLIGSCGQRCNEEIQCKGKFTKYWIFL